MKLAAGIYGEFMTNSDVNNANEKKFGYKPDFSGRRHGQWITDLLSGTDEKVKGALAVVDITDPGEQQQVIDALPKGGDSDVALAIYKRLKQDFTTLHAVHGNEASSHDY
jgi:hypothetical protein